MTHTYTGKLHPAHRSRDSRQDWKPIPQRLLDTHARWLARSRALLKSLGHKGHKGRNTVLLWEGPSRLDGTPIQVIASGVWQANPGTVNIKTGPTVQIYIVPRDLNPHTAAKNGKDSSVCGACPHRPSTGGACYVSTHWGPSMVWKQVNREGAPRIPAALHQALFLDAMVRFGAWGDPAAVPLEVWRPILNVASGWTSYTHQWKDLDPGLWGWCMASVDSPTELRQAQEAEWRTFRVAFSGEPIGGERHCPAQASKVNCYSCRGCDGTASRGRASYFVTPHGPRGRRRQLGLWGSE